MHTKIQMLIKEGRVGILGRFDSCHLVFEAYRMFGYRGLVFDCCELHCERPNPYAYISPSDA